jgi:hypothetical protein
MEETSQLKHYCIYEYFLDGYFLKWQQMRECYLPVEDELREIETKDGKIIKAKVVRTDKVSDSEYKVLLVSVD